jgi:hypothetical protein
MPSPPPFHGTIAASKTILDFFETKKNQFSDCPTQIKMQACLPSCIHQLETL